MIWTRSKQFIPVRNNLDGPKWFWTYIRTRHKIPNFNQWSKTKMYLNLSKYPSEINIFCSFPLANVLTIMDKDFPKVQVISPIWFGSLAKAMVFGHKLVTYQELSWNALSHSKWIVLITFKEHFQQMLETLDNVLMWKRK